MKIFNKKFISLAILASSLIIGGCAGRPIHLGNAQFGNSDQQVKVNEIDFSKGRQISADMSGFQLLLFIPININDRHERAYQILRAQAGNDFMTDIKIKESWTYALVGTVYTTRMEAMVYPYKKK